MSLLNVTEIASFSLCSYMGYMRQTLDRLPLDVMITPRHLCCDGNIRGPDGYGNNPVTRRYGTTSSCGYDNKY